MPDQQAAAARPSAPQTIIVCHAVLAAGLQLAAGRRGQDPEGQS